MHNKWVHGKVIVQQELTWESIHYEDCDTLLSNLRYSNRTFAVMFTPTFENPVYIFALLFLFLSLRTPKRARWYYNSTDASLNITTNKPHVQVFKFPWIPSTTRALRAKKQKSLSCPLVQ